MTLAPDWRVLDGVPTTWFGAPSLRAAAQLAARLPQGSAADLRPTGVRVRLPAAAEAGSSGADLETVSASARDLGLSADPRVVQELGLVLESQNPASVGEFWGRAFDYVQVPGGWVDPLRRDPDIRFGPAGEPRPLRNRIHIDIVRPGEVVERLDLGEALGPYGVRHADPEGNEVDLVPGDRLGDSPATADWRSVFSAVVCYRTQSSHQQRELVRAAAAICDEAGFPMLIDIRPGLAICDSGKDLWDAGAHGLELDFTVLAEDLQSAARDIGAVAEPDRARFAQVFVDAADVDAVRAFWIAALGYEKDPRADVTDIVDPRRLNPEMVFQPLEASDVERRRQRNRIHLELKVPADVVEERREIALRAGGRLTDDVDAEACITDPEGNELVIVSG